MLCPSQTNAVILFLALIGLTAILFWYIWKSFRQNAELENARDFHVVFEQYTQWNYRHPLPSLYDVIIDLNIHYPRGTLIVNDPVNIWAKAILDIKSIKAHLGSNVSLSSIIISFENALSQPLYQDEKGITQKRDIMLQPTQKEELFEGGATITWDLEGSYHPLVSIKTRIVTEGGNSVPGSSPCGPVPNVAIVVYPKSQIAQTITNKVFLYVAIATYLVGAASLLSIIIQLWNGAL